MKPQTYTPDTPQAARNTILLEASEHTCVIYFTKVDGSPRRMVCRYFGAMSRRSGQMVVWDVEKGARRTVNLDTVDVIRVLVTKPVQNGLNRSKNSDFA